MRIRRILMTVVVLALLLMAVPVLSGCGAVAKYSDPMTENILVSMNKGDYAGFSRDFDENMKAELSEASFPDFLAAVNGQVGDYVAGSKDMTGVNVENGITTATYKIDFESMKDVELRMVYQKIDGETKVVGLWFN